MRKLLGLIAALILSQSIGATEKTPDLPREVIINGVEFILIPEGWFYYISKGAEIKNGKWNVLPQREFKAWTDAFYIGKFEARARDFARFMNNGEPRHKSHYLPRPTSQGDTSGAVAGCGVRMNEQGEFFEVAPDRDLPATHLSWDLAREFAAWMGFRLPSDAEWVHAYRGEDKRIYPWGNDYPDDTYASFEEGGTACNSSPVDSRPKGRSPYGVYNMVGNVFEYVADWSNHIYEGKLKEGVRNPLATEPYASPDHEGQVRGKVRGGRWASGPEELYIYGNRETQKHDDPFICYGTRFALDVGVVQDHLRAGTAQVIVP